MKAIPNHSTISIVAAMASMMLGGQVSGQDHPERNESVPIDSRESRPSRNPVIQELERHDGSSTRRNLEHYLEHALRSLQAAPDYAKGFGTARGGVADRHDRFQPDICRAGAEGDAGTGLNLVFWDGTTFDHTGTRPLIDGTEGNDLIIGTVYSDVIHGNGGHDKICAYAGDDIVFGDREEDWASTHPGDGVDVIFGGPGDDILYGGGKTDYLTGGADHDTLLGGHGPDYIQGDGIGGSPDIPAVPAPFHGDDFMVGMADHEWYFGQGGSDNVNDFSFVDQDDDAPPTSFYMDAFGDDGFVDVCHVFWNDQAAAYAGGCEYAFGH